MRMPSTAFQPKWVSICNVVHFHVAATINTGGAAKWVRVPVLEPETGPQFIEVPGQHQGRNGHSSWFGNERSENRADEQRGEPERGQRAAEQFGDPFNEVFGKPQYRAGGGQRHDHHDERRLGEIHMVPDVIDHRVPVVETDDGDHERDGPDTEYGFHFTQEMKQPRAVVDRIAAGLPVIDFFLVFVLPPVGNRHEPGGHERVDDGEKENQRRDQIERLPFDAVY